MQHTVFEQDIELNSDEAADNENLGRKIFFLNFCIFFHA